MQKIEGSYSKDVYIKLIEYLKLNYIEETIYTRYNPEEYNQLKEEVENAFDIDITPIQIKRTLLLKRYTVSNAIERWDFLIGTASLLFTRTMQSYRDQIMEEANIHGVITLKNSFFEGSTIPAAIIVLGNKPAEKIWLTSAASSEDIINIFSDIHRYQRNVYYTEKLDPQNFMPENYNGEKEKLNEALDKYETKTLEEIADIIVGKSVSRWDFGETGIPYLRQRDIQQGIIVNSNIFVHESVADKYAKQLLQEGDILLTKNFGQYKVARVTSDNLPAIASNSLFIIRPFGVSDEYLYRYFTSETGKAILDKQLSSIERGATVVTISLADLKTLRVPIFNEETMLAFSQIEEMKASEVIPVIQQMSRLQAYAERLSVLQSGSQLETKVYDEFIKAGWSQNEIQLNKCIYSVDLKAGRWIPDIALLDGDKWVGAVEIKTDFSNLSRTWASQIREILKEARIPCLILSTGFYYEVHFTHLPIVKKLTEAPSKVFLLSIMNGREGD